jgi:glycosyltransferase involved in cell wall biosynthesis
VKICHLIKPSTHNPLLYNSIKFSDRERFEYSVVSLDPKGELHAQMDELGVTSVSLARPSRKLFAKTSRELFQLFRKERFDAIQVHGFDASLVGLPAAVTARVPNRIFSGHHSHEIPLHKNWKLMAVDSFLASRLSTHVIAPSKNMRDIFVRDLKVPAKKVHVIPHGIDLDEWSPEKFDDRTLRDQYGVAPETAVFAAVGRLYWVKGFDHLIRAFAGVVRERDDAVLWIIGDGSDRGTLESMIKQLGLEKKILLLGNRADIARVMSQVDVFVHPAFAESFGLVYVEAMALGKPVIGTAVGIAPDLIRDGENGFLMASNDDEIIRQSMLEMLSRRAQWPEMSIDARRSAEPYSVVLTQRECDDFYASLA